MSIFTAVAFPWDHPNAMELWRTLYTVVPRPQRALQIVASIGMDKGMFLPDQSPADLWQQVLERASPAAKLRPLLEKIADDPSTATGHPFLRSLLDGQRPQRALDGEPADSQGKPVFLKSDDTVFEQEALLFLDDLTIPAGRVPWLIDVLRILSRKAASVCRLEVSLNNRSKSGTAFRVGDDLLLTNWHVLSVDGYTPTTVSAEFGFDTDAAGNALQSVMVPCRADSIRTNKTDDWGVIRTSGPLPPDIPIIHLATDAADPVRGDPAFIIQHPLGNRKRLAFVRNQVTDLDEQVVHYITDTQVGSSGAPVFDQQGRVIACHHAGGRPQEIAGKPPVKKNEGIRISRILAGLRATGMY